MEEGRRAHTRRLGALRLLHEYGWFVGAGTPTCGHRDVQQPEVNAELAAMLVPVAQHDVTEKRGPRLRQDFPFAGNQAPGFRHGVVVEFRQEGAYRSDTLVESLQDLRAAGGLAEIGKIRRLRRVVLN